MALYTKVEVHSPLTAFTLRVGLPTGLRLGTYRSFEPALSTAEGGRSERERGPSLPTTTWSGGDEPVAALNWREEGELRPGDRFEYVVEARVAPAQQNLAVASRAAVTARTARGGTVRDQETAVVHVEAKSRALKYLPSIYRDDELMGRFLMLFESFWEPVGRQIDGLSYYFDPEITPSEFLPWLASWIDLILDEQWPEDRRRKLLQSAIPLFRKRGTRQGLAEYLEIFAGVQPEIVEYRAQNFRLGMAGQLGSGIALGKDNVPHTFAVRLQLPPVKRSGAANDSDSGQAERQELLRQRKIEAIINAQKPAHTRYRLFLDIRGESTLRHARGDEP